MKSAYDVVIVGGAVIGSAVAYYLMSDPAFDGTVLIVERDTTWRQCSTALSAASIRTQFSNRINVEISQYGLTVIRAFGEMMEIDGHRPTLNFQPGGYLFLAASEAQETVLRENHAVQVACGADVVLWTPDELAAAFPHLRTEDLRLASYGLSGEGWFDNVGMMAGFRAKARALGADFLHGEVTGIAREGSRVTEVEFASGERIAAGTVVNAAGPRAAQVARMAGLDIPVEPRKRTLFVFDCARSPQGMATVNEGRLPLMIDPTGVFLRPEGRYFLAGCPPAEDPTVDWDDFEPRHEEFEEIVWPALAARSESFEAIKLMNTWAGHYAWNRLDHNLVVGPHHEVDNFLFANGFSGHGLQQAPATGRAISELIVHGGFRTLDLSEVGFDRVVAGRPFLERAVI